MNQILAKRYAFCDFSSIVGFPNQVPTRDEWENSLPRFQGEEWEVPAEHLLDFHDYMHRLQVVHEDVQIWLFCFSLEGIAHDWYRSFPNASISSLAEFHVAFHLFCKTKFSIDLLYPECCHEFSVLNKDLNNYEKIVAAEDISHHDQEIGHPHHDNHSDAFVIASNASPGLCFHEEEIVPIENLKGEEQILILANDSFRSAEDEEDNLPFPDLEGLSNIQLENEDHDQECVYAAYVMGTPHFLDLQTKADCSRHLHEGQQKGPDQKFSSYVSPAEIPQSTFINEFFEGNEGQLQHCQLEQQLKEVFSRDFEDPIADLLDSFSCMNVKIFMSEEDYLIHLLKPFFCMIWSLLLCGSRFSMIPVNHFLTWLYWKYAFT
jgi:hypothetical protein